MQNSSMLAGYYIDIICIHDVHNDMRLSILILWITLYSDLESVLSLPGFNGCITLK